MNKVCKEVNYHFLERRSEMLSNRWFYGNPWGDLNRIVREMNDLFTYSPLYSRESTQKKHDFPVNMWSNKDEILVIAELPGLAIENLHINALKDTLIIEGEYPKDEDEKKITYHRQERNGGKFKRVFQLPNEIDPEKVNAKYDKGILTVTLPLSEETKPKKIDIKVG